MDPVIASELLSPTVWTQCEEEEASGKSGYVRKQEGGGSRDIHDPVLPLRAGILRSLALPFSDDFQKVPPGQVAPGVSVEG